MISHVINMLFTPTCKYVSPEYLAEEIQSAIDNFEKGVLKRANAHISVTYDAVSQRMKISAQNEKQVRLLFPKQFGQILGLEPKMMEKSIGNEKHTYIADFTFVGDILAPILRVVPFNPATESIHVHKELKKLALCSSI